MALRKLIDGLAFKLTERRIRAHAFLLALCLWSLYALDLATPGLRDRFGMLKGADFMHFYTLGTLVNRGQWSALYDMAAQARLMPTLLPPSAGLIYIPLYGPQVALVLAPFAKLPYVPALIAWWIVTTIIYGASCYLIWTRCPRLRESRSTVLVVALGYPAFFALIAWGQSSAPALLAFALGYVALRVDRRFLAGLAIGVLAYKPSLAVGPAIVFLAAAEWRIVAGAILSAVAQLAFAWAYFGTVVMKAYAKALLNAPHQFGYVEPKVYMVHSLRAFWAMLVPAPKVAFVLYVACAIAVLVLAVRTWKGTAALDLTYSSLLLATVLVAPHLTIYDLVIVAPVFMLVPECLQDSNNSFTAANENADGVQRLLLYLCYGLPLLGPVTRWTHIQLSALAFAALLYVLWHRTKPARSRVSPTGVRAEMRVPPQA